LLSVTRMKIRRLEILLLACCLLFGCQRERTLPSDSFQLVVHNVVSNEQARVCLLTVRIWGAAILSVQGDDVTDQIALPKPKNRRLSEGQVALAGSLVATNEPNNFTFIQTLVRPQISPGSFSGG